MTTVDRLLEGPPQLAVGALRRLRHLVDADAYSLDFAGVPLYFARCGAVSIPTMSPGSCSWCLLCQPESVPWQKSAPSS